MGRLNTIENHVAGVTKSVSSAYVPAFQLTEGQPPPIAANGGLSYMSFDRDGDAGTAAATEAALRQIAEGQGHAVVEMIDKAPPGPIKTKWGVGFRTYAECLEYIRANNIKAPEGGVALPLRYTVYEQPSYSIVPSNALWRDPAREEWKSTTQVSHPAAPSAWTSLALRWRTASPSAGTFTTRRRWSACTTRRWRSSSWSFSRTRRMRSCTTTTCLTRTTRATAPRTRTTRTRV